jgi:hypothetical protein
MSDHDQPTTPAAADPESVVCPDCGHAHAGTSLAGICIGCPCPTRTAAVPRPDDRPTVMVTDEATLVPAHLLHLLAALTAPAPEGTANPDPSSRAELADWARDDIIDAHAVLLGEIHDIDFHNYADGGDWLYSGQPVEQIAEQALHLAERLTQAAADARATIAAATARRDWLTSARPLRCLGCGEVIDPSLGDWRVCRGTAEHDWCHHEDDPATEDNQRRWTAEDAEDDAYSEDRIRSGGPYPGDVIEVTYPGTGHPITAIWESDPDQPDGPGRARIDTSGRIVSPDGTTSPVPGHETPDLLDLAGATGIRIIHTREELQDEADVDDDPADDGGSTACGCGGLGCPDLAGEEVVWVGRPGDYDPNADEARDDTPGGAW